MHGECMVPYLVGVWYRGQRGKLSRHVCMPSKQICQAVSDQGSGQISNVVMTVICNVCPNQITLINGCCGCHHNLHHAVTGCLGARSVLHCKKVRSAAQRCLSSRAALSAWLLLYLVSEVKASSA